MPDTTPRAELPDLIAVSSEGFPFCLLQFSCPAAAGYGSLSSLLQMFAMLARRAAFSSMQPIDMHLGFPLIQWAPCLDSLAAGSPTSCLSIGL